MYAMQQLTIRQSWYTDSLWSAVSLGLAISLITENPNLEAMSLLYFLLHMMTAVLFLIRRLPLRHSSIWQSYFVAGLSTIYMYGYDLSDPFESHYAPIGSALIVTGLILSLFSLLSLGRCFGVLPKYRGLMTTGFYRIMRHPLYASYIVMDIGLIIGYPSTWNIILFLLALTLFIRRIHYEELLLQGLAGYRAYMAAVKFRLLPFVY